MKKYGFVLAAAYFLVMICMITPIFAEYENQEDTNAAVSEDSGRVLVIREAMQRNPTTVAVEAYLMDNVLEVKVIARMLRSRPRIFNCIVKGPKLGRLAPETRTPIKYTLEKEEPFSTKKAGGFISFGPDEEEKDPKGTLKQEMFQYVLPVDKIKKDKKYELWIKIQGTTKNQQIKGFKFELTDLYELLQEQLENK